MHSRFPEILRGWGGLATSRPSVGFAQRRQGLTLTELLVVVSIVILLAGVFVPLMQPILQGQNTREAARQLNVFLAGAQARAVEQGRPVGVWIERATHDPMALPEKWFTAYKLYLAEQPLPYIGDVDNTMAFRFTKLNAFSWSVLLWTPDTPLGASIDVCPGVDTQVRPGDLIQFEYRGPLYTILANGPDPKTNAVMISFRVDLESTTPAMSLAHTPVKYATTSMPVPFTIYRQPVKTAAAPIELPNNVALDLSVSGYAHYGALTDSLTSFRRLLHWENSDENVAGRTLSPEHDIVMMFSPDGGVDSVYYVSHEHEGTFAEKPLGNVSLLVVRDDKIGKDLGGQSNIIVPPVTTDTFEDPKLYLGFQQPFYQDNIKGPLGEASLADKTAIWVTVSGHSGRVYSAPNQGLDTGLNISATRQDARQFVAVARQMADQGQSVGGR